jgi:hypothetical protein
MCCRPKENRRQKAKAIYNLHDNYALYLFMLHVIHVTHWLVSEPITCFVSHFEIQFPQMTFFMLD